MTSTNTETARDSNTNQIKVFQAVSADQVECSCIARVDFVRELIESSGPVASLAETTATLINYRKSTIDQEDFGSTVNYWRLPWTKSVRGDYPVQKLVTAVDWILCGDCPCSEAGDCPGIKLVRGDCRVQKSTAGDCPVQVNVLVEGET